MSAKSTKSTKGTKKRRRSRRNDKLVLDLLIIVTLVLVIFEGNLIRTMIRQHSASNIIIDTASGNVDSGNDSDIDTSKKEEVPTVEVSDSTPIEATLAGLPGKLNAAGTDAQTSQIENTRLPTVSNPDSPAIVQEITPSVDDSYFSDAAFIGDSRMEGFRMASGITQGRFFTSIGMSLSSMRSESVIQTTEGNITVAAALSGDKYSKVYIMLGTNDLGEYDWDSFKEGFISVLHRFQEIQPDAIFYICSVIYVDESKIADTQYINNTNVDKINSILLDICQEESYHYLDLNEILSNGYGSLIEGASSDGVHLYENYCKEMLKYLKSHYIEVQVPEAQAEGNTDQAQQESETEDGD